MKYAEKRPLTAIEKQDSYQKMALEHLLAQCYERIPSFSITLNVFGRGQPVMASWRYDFRSPMAEWHRARPQEMAMGGVYRSIREALVTVLSRVDRFDLWTYEQKKLKAETAARALRAALAAPVEKPREEPEPEPDEGEEEVEAEELPPVMPLPEEPAVLTGDKPVVKPLF